MIYYEINYLAHHGVKGMKWGVRKERERANIQRRRADYKLAKKQARRDYNIARNTIKTSSSFIVQSPEKEKANQKRIEKAVNRSNTSQLNAVKARAELSKAKRGDKGEMRAYVREMYKSGAPGSQKDAMSGGRSTAIYNDLKKRKGKKYAEEAFKKTRNRAISTFAVGTTVAVGSAIALGILSS